MSLRCTSISDNNGLQHRALRALALRFAPGHAFGTSATLNVMWHARVKRKLQLLKTGFRFGRECLTGPQPPTAARNLDCVWGLKLIESAILRKGSCRGSLSEKISLGKSYFDAGMRSKSHHKLDREAHLGPPTSSNSGLYGLT